MSEDVSFILVTYSQGQVFARSQEVLSNTFLQFSEENSEQGKFPRAISLRYSEDTIRLCSWYKNISDLKNDAGYAGEIYYWAWKPHILLDVINNISKEGDIILYCDSSRYDRRGFVEDPLVLFELMKREGYSILASGFSHYLLNSHSNLFSDGGIFKNCGEWSSFQSPHVVASHLAIKNCDFSKEFLGEWSMMCRDHSLIKRNRVADQALLNVLIQKHKIPAINFTKVLSNKLLPHRDLKSINYVISSLKRQGEGVTIEFPGFSIAGYLLGWFWEGVRVLRRAFSRLKKQLSSLMSRRDA
ncbi:hypothetical protein [uncultured Cohaesibacter sp.]|uniref:hypothetical protein n=1 Tax=uncultured Cohaesibacter sp. TaxID=1002546 RepID=UPI0029C609AD|nr:hypothetical protein [uncultured Cohaesibacter sp.]